MSVLINADTSDGLKFTSDTSGEIKLQSAGTDIATVNSSGITLATGKDLTLSSTALDASASGIYLGGTASANLLDDYEEGTWTPTVSFSGASTGITYNYNDGLYTKVGNLVTVGFSILLTSKGSSTGSFWIEGLPFTSANSNVWNQAHPYAVRMSFASNLSFYAAQNSNYLIFVEFTDAGSPSFINQNDINNDTSIRGSLTYFTEA